jgi:hypothetical protein
VAAAARRRHGLEVEHEGHLMNFAVIVLLRCFLLFDICLNARVLFEKIRVIQFIIDLMGNIKS